MIDDIVEDNVTATLAVFPIEMGRIAMQAINDYFEGEEISQIIYTPTEIVDKDNVERFK